MSTANAPANVQSGQKAVLPEHGQSELTEPKFTAAQIEAECPPLLQQIGNEIKERLEKARKYHQQAEDHLIAVNARINEAKRLCDDGGFNKFRERFCPELGKSQSYVLRAIAAGKKTLAEHRAEERKRKRKSRANHKAVAANSGTVPEKPSKEECSTGTGALRVTNSTTEQTPEPAKPRSTGAAKEAMRVFTAAALELRRVTDKKPPGHFSATPVPVEVLERLGNLFIGIAKLKKSETAKSAPSTGGGVTSVEPSAEDLRIDDELDARVSTGEMADD
jgi:hypothetical protein